MIASNSSDMDYVGLAAINARLIRKHLGIPVCLITTDLTNHDDFDHVIKVDHRPGQTRKIRHDGEIISYEWKNDHRISAIDHTPYERTLLIDADYLVQTDALLPFISCDSDFMIVDEVRDLTAKNSFRNDAYLPDRTLKQRWATVMVFNKDYRAPFDIAAMVRDNYDYYAAMFNWSRRPFRNDFAFTVAAHLLSIPRMPFVMNQISFEAQVQADERGLKIMSYDQIFRWNHDVHVLNKEIAINPKMLEPLLDA